MSKITIIGSGNIGFSLAKGLVKSNIYKAEDIFLTRRTLASLSEEEALGFGVSADNPTAIQGAEIIVLAVLPQQMKKVMEDIAPTVQPNQIIVSVASGVSCQDVKEILGQDQSVGRAMPNTAIAIGQAMTCIATQTASAEAVGRVDRLFDAAAAVVVIGGEWMTSATALGACGIAVFLRA